MAEPLATAPSGNSFKAVLAIRDVPTFARLLAGLPQRQVDDLMLARFDAQLAWVNDRLATLGVPVGGAEGWSDAPLESVDWLVERSVELALLLGCR